MSDLGYINSSGEYVEGKDKPMGFDISSQYKSWSRDNQRKRFQKDITQPWKNGEPSREFIEAFPEESKRYFTDSQRHKAERNLGGLR
jgi:hypothetical protein